MNINNAPLATTNANPAVPAPVRQPSGEENRDLQDSTFAPVRQTSATAATEGSQVDISAQGFQRAAESQQGRTDDAGNRSTVPANPNGETNSAPNALATSTVNTTVVSPGSVAAGSAAINAANQDSVPPSGNRDTTIANSGAATAPSAGTEAGSARLAADAGAAERAVETEQQSQEAAETRRLSAIDRNVRAHEAAHSAAGGSLTSAPTFETVTGPNGRQFAVGGEVQIQTGGVSGDTEASLQQAEQVRRAALAPADPSPQDRSVAAQATQQAAQARAELVTERAEAQDETAAQATAAPEDGAEVSSASTSTVATAADTASSTTVGAPAVAEPGAEVETDAAAVPIQPDENGATNTPEADDILVDTAAVAPASGPTLATTEAGIDLTGGVERVAQAQADNPFAQAAAGDGDDEVQANTPFEPATAAQAAANSPQNLLAQRIAATGAIDSPERVGQTLNALV